MHAANTTPIDEIRPITNPGTLVDGDHHTSELVAEKDQAHFETRDDLAGFAALGITNADGAVLLKSASEGQFWRLPHTPIKPSHDYVERIEHVTKETLGFEIQVRSVVGVRRVDVVLQNSTAASRAANDSTASELTGLEGHTVSHDIAFEARLDGVDDPSAVLDAPRSGVMVEWFDSVPEGAPPGLPGDDIALFVG